MTTPTADQGHLAALIDGEPGPGGFEVAIDAAERDAELRARYERALLIGQVLRGEPSLPSARLVSARVSDALATEPVVMRPTRRRPAQQLTSISRAPINRSAAGIAIAASLGALAILVGPGLMTGRDRGPAQAGAPMAQSAPAEGLEHLVPATHLVERWAVMDEPASSTALDELLVDHRERASASGLTGFIPYAAVVGPSGVR
ncbi:MAG: sigma-E factor negative regulatory protein [Lamprobacter sp.]|uniref:sigma-E factor negative regulatory protein n=1 Tax=Lamprobacter sp. TaxID=3100796 RepID=UPI002B25A2AF|nr:sigma-E factor negative regulatory protein [Lamprobacter sp.]MEA3640040.1 sigma-E factor negative regulatory protein [Lamprobacter sp.]